MTSFFGFLELLIWPVHSSEIEAKADLGRHKIFIIAFGLNLQK